MDSWTRRTLLIICGLVLLGFIVASIILYAYILPSGLLQPQPG